MTDICSIWSYHEIVEDGIVAGIQGMCLAVFSEAKNPLTVQEASDAFRSRFPNNYLKPHPGLGCRIKELEDMGFLEKFDIVRCHVTKKRVNRWAYTGRRQPRTKTVVCVDCPRCKGSGKVERKVYLNEESQMEIFK